MTAQCTSMIIFNFFITQVVLLVSQHQYCNTSYECVDNAWILSSGQHMFGNGYKSLSGSTTSITSNYNNTYIYCYAAYSCTEISFILSESDVYCESIHSCSNIAGSSYIDAPYVACRGSKSCQNSNIRSKSSNSYVHCEGDQSCNYANISSKVVYAQGAYSMYGSIIDTNNITNSYVHLLGYQSGFGAKIICRSGDICNIYCYSVGCQMLYLLCEDNSNCNIVLNWDVAIPPITNINDFDDNLYDIKYINYNTDQLCNNSSSQFVYDDYQQQNVSINMDIDNGGPVCCRGTESCRYAGTIQFTATPDILICSGRFSCYQINITTTGPIFCEGYHSCYRTNINGSDNVYCLGGSNSCANNVITHSKNVYCSGYHSCAYSRIESDGSALNIYLLGRSSGWELDIYCGVGDECVILCGGHHSCLTTILFCNNNCLVYCNNNTHNTGCPVGNYTLIELRSTTALPTKNPTLLPTSNPTSLPTSNPTSLPTSNPTLSPTSNPTSLPTLNPTSLPTLNPTSLPTLNPTSLPTSNPTLSPTSNPTSLPTSNPISLPTSNPISLPTSNPTSLPTSNPTSLPTSNPTSLPTSNPISLPTNVHSTYDTEHQISTQSQLEKIHSIISILVILMIVLTVFIIVMFVALMKIRQNINKKQDIDANNANMNGVQNHERVDIDPQNNDNDSDIENKEEKMEEALEFGIEMQHINLNDLKLWFNQQVAIPNSNDIYYELFIKNGYETMDIVRLLTEDRLKSIGIKKQGHIDKIMFEINKLKQENNVYKGEHMNYNAQSGIVLDSAGNED